MVRSREIITLRRIGNGQGFLISKSICNLLGMGVDDPMRVEIEGDRLILTPLETEEGAV